MTKKIIGIFLLVLGGAIFLWTGYGFVKNLTMTKQEMIEQVKTDLAKKGVDNYFFSDKQLEKMLDESTKRSKKISPLIMFIGAGIAFGGFALYKRGKKDAQISDTFKF
jgi:uncharacterized protein with PQ loop repeat